MVETQAPELSVVVAIIDGGDCLRDFLRAALAFADAPAHEIIVPYDQTCPEVPAMQAEFPAVRFLDMGHVATGHPVTTEAGRHELYDRRKSFGLKAALAWREKEFGNAPKEATSDVPPAGDGPKDGS